MLPIRITSSTFPPWTEVYMKYMTVTMKNDFEIYLVDYKLCQFFSVLTIRFLGNRAPSHVVHDCVINTSNVEFLGKMRCVREGNAIICTSSTWCTENKI